MKALWCVLLSFLLGCGLVRLAAAGVYAYTAEDGSVSLSNVPADNRYRVLIPDQKDNAQASSPNAEQKVLSALAGKARYDRIVDDAARTYGLEGALLHAVISVESHYNPKAVSRKGASGLMQLMPATARRYGVADSFDPVQNIEGGARYLRDLLKMFNSDLSLALAAYNAGENAVVRSGNRIPPIRETRDYVPKVLGFYRKYQVDL
ncbi:lytic transglycosylase domain-containing protein [Sulfurimicrobium lacus]|uniref:lytic transglycosylase domain-containing protein n=1 Tax=Sulfurimicrobium lacus TaxID=2715678 RepID=UPI001563E7F6|nr:lytic transglycosylase domain-containing protein [Sulfurimicrobium lacus]